jgi:uncharacterized membrane protein YdjX (TVP38/TMEM64 family)
MTSAEELKKYIEGYGNNAYVVFFIIQVLSVIIAPIPSNISAVVGGSIFGMWYSFFISILAIIIGSIVVYIFGRILGRTFAERFIKPEILSRYEQYSTSANIAIPLWAWGIIAIIIICLAKNSNKLEAKLVAVMKAV